MVFDPPAHTEKEMPGDSSAHPRQAEAIEATLHEIFLSSPFKASRQSQQLMRYIVSNTVTGNDLLLRERIIGIEVFSRRPDYDTGEDPVVRLRASDLRKRLAQFYQGNMGRSVPLQISIPSGSYRADFVWQNSADQASIESEAALPLPDNDGPRALQAEPKSGHLVGENSTIGRVPKSLIWIMMATLIGSLTLALIYWRGNDSSALDQFWGPLMKDPHPTLVCMGSNAVYRLSNNFLDEYKKRSGEPHDGIEFLIDPVAGEKIDQRDLLRANNSFVALGDVAAASNLVSFLGSRGKNFTERFPPDMSFAEIQEYSSILIGGFNNQMALTITKDLPFVMKGSDRIEERANPQHNWRLQFYGDARESEDYALISRIVNPDTKHEVVTLGGIGQYGTQAAADFLTDPAGMKAWAAGMPSGWNRGNLQIILHVKVIDYRPVGRTVVASKTW